MSAADTDWIVLSPRHLVRYLNGWHLNANRSASEWRVTALSPSGGVSAEVVTGLTNALIIAENMAVDPEPPPPGLRERTLAALRDEIARSAA